MHERLFAKAGLSLERLKTFTQLVDACGFTAAAKGDANRQSQFSRQLKELEEYFGAELVKRGRGGFALTAAGEALQRIVHSHFSALDDFVQTCGNQPVELSLGGGESLLQWLVLPRLARIRQSMPQCRLILKNLQAEEIVEQLTCGRTNFGLVRKSAIGRSLRSAPVAAMEYALFVPRSLCPEARSKKPINILADLPLALLEGGGSVGQALQEEARRGGFRLNVIVECSSYTQSAEVVRGLEAGAVLPVRARCVFDQGTVEEITLPFLSRLRRSMVLAWNPRSVHIRPALAQACKLLPGLLG